MVIRLVGNSKYIVFSMRLPKASVPGATEFKFENCILYIGIGGQCAKCVQFLFGRFGLAVVLFAVHSATIGD